MAAAENHREMLMFLIQQTNFNFTLKDNWNKKPYDDIRDTMLKKDVAEALKCRALQCRRASACIENKDKLLEKKITSVHIVKNKIAEEIHEADEEDHSLTRMPR